GMEEQTTPPKKKNCYQTQSVGQCGTNLNLGGVACGIGQPTCYAKVITYGHVFNCVVAQSGLDACATGQCKKHEFDFACDETLNICVLVKEYAPVNIMPISFASGAGCTPITDPSP
ncbi:MAG: hypothetical protein O7D94_13510, partial [Planctomycetota bacterium]|nr:hypothetical protein [Planctomycetota bacterium]